MDERGRQDIEVLKILFDADFPDFSNRLSAAKTKNGTVDPFSITLEPTQFVRIPDKNNKLRIVKKSAIVSVWNTGFVDLATTGLIGFESLHHTFNDSTLL